MKIKQKQIRDIELILKKIFLEYKNQGMLAIYLWGSILTEDFNFKSSDIDSIAIVSDKAKIKDNKNINCFLKKNLDYRDFKLNYLYKNELNGGRIRSRLARVIDPRLLLLDFKNWKYVAGKKYSRKNFKLKEISFDEAIKLNLKTIKKKHLLLLKKGNFNLLQYFVKNLLKINHYLNEKDFGEHKFSYKSLIKFSPEKRKKVVRILLKMKKSKWDKNLAKKNLPLLIDFINTLSNL